MKRSDYTHFALQIILFFTSLSTDLNAQENEAAPVQETALEETEEPSELKMTVVTAERPVPTRLKPEVPRTFVQPVVIDDDRDDTDPGGTDEFRDASRGRHDYHSGDHRALRRKARTDGPRVYGDPDHTKEKAEG